MARLKTAENYLMRQLELPKYKKNRTVTEKSLEQERQNLERVTDILAELEKQVGPLEKQSAKGKGIFKTS